MSKSSVKPEEARGALRRARIRLRYHGWRQGADPGRSRGAFFPGYNLVEAVVGKGGGLGTPAEHLALVMLAAHVMGLRTGDLTPPADLIKLLTEWNDAPYQTKERVLKLIDNVLHEGERALAKRMAETPVPLEVATKPNFSWPGETPEEAGQSQYLSPGDEDHQEGEL